MSALVCDGAHARAHAQVGLLVVVGHILNIPVALLGATFLSWGNAMSDCVNNLTFAKDGKASMAITACFASPIFILLAGERGSESVTRIRP